LTSVRDGKKIFWQNSYIGKLLRNEVYLGHQIQGKYERRSKKEYTEKSRSEWVVHENAHPAIIDQSQFDTVQRLMDEAGARYKKLGNKLDENILVGKIFCSRCGKALKRQYKHKTKKREIIETLFSYLCRDCNTELRYTMELEAVLQLPLEKLEGVITVVLQKYMDACLNIDTLIDDVIKSPFINKKRHSFAVELNKLQRDSKKADDMLAAAYTHHLARLLDSNEFNLARVKFEREKQIAEIGAERVVRELEKYDVEKNRHNAFLTNFKRFKGFEGLNKSIINTLIQRIDITPLTNEISITLNFMDELEQLNKIIEESEVLSDVLKQ
jgi:RNase P subunit RPR2